MERIILRKGAYLLLLLLVSCTSELEKDYVNSNDIDNVVMQTTGFRAESSSRTYPSIDNGYVNILWSENDVVGVFPNEGSQAAFPMSSAAGTTQASFNGGGWALKTSYKYAAYYPYEFENRDYTKIPVSYLGQKQIGKNTSTHTGAYNYMVASATTPSEGKANFTFQNMGCMVIMDLTVPEPTTLNTVVLSADGEKFTTKGEINIMEEEPTITSTAYSGELRIDLENFTTTSANEVVSIYFMTAPINLYGKTINVRVYDNKGNLQETSIAGKNLEAGGFYSLVGTLPTVPIISNVFTVPQAGQLSTIVPTAQKDVITEMKIIGDLNGDDIRFIREMAGRDVDGNETSGQLQKLDLSEANIVEGGAAYYLNNNTTNNVFGERMFYQCNITTILISPHMTKIGKQAFSATKITNIIIPNNIKEIEDAAFSSCENLANVVLPNNIKAISTNAFGGCVKLESITIPECVTTIDTGAFRGCTTLTNITLPNSVTSIGNTAFEQCVGLANVTFPNNLKSIGWGAFMHSGLTSALLPNSVTIIEDYAFSYSDLKIVKLSSSLVSMGVSAFEMCDDLTDLIIPQSIINIPKSSFLGCKMFNNIKIPEGILTIGESAFNGSGINNLELPGTLKEIYANGFANNQQLESITCLALVPPVVYETSFKNVNKTSTIIYVPTSAVDAYKVADGWKEFANIEAIDE